MNSRETRPIDFDARSDALDIGRSFIVQAPAGSGKTELLIQRYLKLLAHVDAPEKVLAITFTRKAAGEMRDRVMQSLELAGAEQPKQPHERLTWTLARQVIKQDSSLGWELQSRPGRMAIMTIDSFNSVLARRISLPAAFPSSAGISDRPAELYELAAERVLDRLGSGGAGGESVEILVGHLDNNLPRVVSLVSSMLARRDHWLRHVVSGERGGVQRAFLEQSIARVVEEGLAEVARLIPEEILQDLVQVAIEAARFAPESALEVHRCGSMTGAPAPRADELESWQALAGLVLTGAGTLRKQLNKNLGFPPTEPALKGRMADLLESLRELDGAEQALASVLELPPVHYSPGQWRVLEALLVLLRLAAAELDVLFGEQEQTDYSAVAMAALRALGEEQNPTDLALYLDHRLQHILVDEFQDTSSGQYRLLRQLVAGWSQGDGRTLFCVGDPMQAIYRFREAKVGYFLDARRQGIGDLKLHPLTLRANFRSRSGLIDWVNQVFPRVFPPQENQTMEAISYSPCQATRDAGVSPAVQIHAAADRDDEAEAARVVELTEQVLSQSREADVAVLVRSRNHLRAITRAYRRCGIPYRAVDIESLADRPVVLDLLALTRALLHPADRTAWLSILRAPYCGLQDSDLLVLAQAAGERSIGSLLLEPLPPGLSIDGTQRLARCIPVVTAVLAERGRRPLRDWVEGAWLALGGPAAHRDPGDLEDAESYLALLETAEQGGDLDDLDTLDAMLQEQRAAGLSTAGARVQVMTIHKSKGLEFHTVILPGLGRTGRSDEPPLLRWEDVVRHDSDNDLLLAPLAPRGDEKDPLHTYLGKMEHQRGAQELRRLLYVAVTRGRERVHLLGHAARLKDGSLKPSSGSLLWLIWEDVKEAFEGPEHASAPKSDPRPEKTLYRLESDWSAPKPESPRYALPVTAGAVGPASQSLEFDWASESIRLTGTVVHRWLERMAKGGEYAWKPANVASELPRLRRALRVAGLPEARLQEAAERAVDALLCTLADDKGKWILFGDHQDSWSELALTGLVDEQAVSVIIDRVILDSEGCLWVVDYKTSRHEGSGLEAFLDSEKQRYMGQLQRYKRLVSAWKPGFPVRSALYFPLMASWVEL